MPRFEHKASLGIVITILLSACNKSDSKPVAAPTPPTLVSVSHEKAQPEKYDGPFGLKMGLTKSEVKNLIPDLKDSPEQPGGMQATSVPIPHPDFDVYLLQFSEKSGLCMVGAISKDISSGSTGAEVKNAFDSIDEALTAKYGKGKKFDYSNDRYSAEEFWMLHLLQNDQTLAKVWSKENESNLNSNINSVTVKAAASNISTGYLVISYKFNNYSDCASESKHEKNKGL